MQVLVDFFPIVVFAAAYWARGIYVATAAIMVAMVVQIGYQWFRHRKVNQMVLVSGLLVVAFGTLTLVLRNPAFIKWKVTVIDWLFAGAFLANQIFGKKTLAERALGEVFSLSEALWRQLNVVWIFVFFALGLVNIYVMYSFSEAVWVSFKVIGGITVPLLTIIGEVAWIYRRAPEAFQAAFSEPVPEKDDGANAREETRGGS
jgi:intracellular septation protein